jgi:hypothetical protein
MARQTQDWNPRGNASEIEDGQEETYKICWRKMRDHIMIATEVVAAAKSGNQPRLAETQSKWSANGRDIAAFLSSANPNWSRQDLEAMMQKHLDLTTGEVVGRLSKDWNKDVRSYDDGHAHMLMFADTLTVGIAKQFPEKVRMAQR